MTLDLSDFVDLDYCYLTTTGRVTGRPHTIEIWFAVNDQALYLLSGGGETSDWVKNLRRAPEVEVRLHDTRFAGRARIATDAQEDALTRTLVFSKYQSRYDGDLTEWRDTAAPVAIDLATRLS